MLKSNPNLIAAYCIRCHHQKAVQDFHEGCPSCLNENFPASMQLQYQPAPFTINLAQTGMQRFPTYLPYIYFPTLHEGNTPLIEIDFLTKRYQINKVFVKYEGTNPTGSHKDRFSALFIARAIATEHRTVIVASSGNAGLSVATFANNAGLHAVVVSTNKIPTDKKSAILQTGAELIIKENALERWAYVREQVINQHWYPATNYLIPPVGSHSFGVEAYKTIAYEIVTEMQAEKPTVIIVPCSRGDLLWGIWTGLKEIWGCDNPLPRMIACEPFPRLSRVLQGEDYRHCYQGNAYDMFSIDGSTVTLQSVLPLQESGGEAVVVSNDEAKSSQAMLVKHNIHAELSSATALAALGILAQKKKISKEDNVVLVVTARA